MAFFLSTLLVVDTCLYCKLYSNRAWKRAAMGVREDRLRGSRAVPLGDAGH
jgi:hypothetical protein